MADNFVGTDWIRATEIVFTNLVGVRHSPRVSAYPIPTSLNCLSGYGRCFYLNDETG